MGELAVGIVAHVSRQESIRRLSNAVRPDVVIPDDGSAGVGANHIAVLTHLLPTARAACADWVVVMEDDALPVDGFRPYATVMLEVAPTPIVSFYLGTGHPLQYQDRCAAAVKSDASWIIHTHLRHAVAYAVHVSLVKELARHMITLTRLSWAPDDAISAYAGLNGHSIAYTNPSLVDHDDKLPPVVTGRTFRGRRTGGRKYPRRAHNFGTPLTTNDTCVTL